MNVIAAPDPINPFAPTTAGRYADELVVVVRRQGSAAAPATGVVRTEHFDLWREFGRVHLVHRLPARAVDNDLAGQLADELFTPGWISGIEIFERLLTGIVLSSGGSPQTAWLRFYRNTLRRLTSLRHSADPTAAYGSLAGFAPVYAHAVDLASQPAPSGSAVRLTALELGCCFGFLSLQLAKQAQVTATDVSVRTVQLLARMAPLLGVALDSLACDAARVPLSDAAVDVVVVVHLLEHLEPRHGAAVVAEAVRLARRRVLVAVPYEAEPTVAFGHVRTLDATDLAELGRASGWRFDVHSHHGGWLVLDRPG